MCARQCWSLLADRHKGPISASLYHRILAALTPCVEVTVTDLDRFLKLGAKHAGSDAVSSTGCGHAKLVTDTTATAATPLSASPSRSFRRVVVIIASGDGRRLVYA